MEIPGGKIWVRGDRLGARGGGSPQYLERQDLLQDRDQSQEGDPFSAGSRVDRPAAEAEAAARAKLTTAYEKFMAEGDPAKKNQVGEDLIRSIFGRGAIAEDPLR